MAQLKDNQVHPTAALLEAIACIDRTGTQIALVVDDDNRLLGVVTDGDVRRALLRNLPLSTPVAEIMKRNPRTAPATIDQAGALGLMRALGVSQLPLVDDQGRVVDLQTMSGLLRRRRRTNRVVLMAGGMGVRLRPLTEKIPKPMLPIGGKPLLQTILEAFIEQGFYRFSISLNYMGDVISGHFGDGAKWGVDIEYLREDRRMGTAGSLALLTERPEEPFLVMNGDILTAVDFKQMLQFHLENQAIATMGLRDHEVQVPYGVITVDGHRLTAIVEKPVEHFFINAGIYVLDPTVLDLIPPETCYDMPELFQTLMADSRRTVAFPIREYWLDIGHPRDLERAESEFSNVFG